MNKKILIGVMAAVLFLGLPQTNNALAANIYTDGLLDNYTLYSSSGWSPYYSDNNLGTAQSSVTAAASVGSRPSITFNKPMNLNGMFAKPGGNTRVYFYDVNNNIINTQYFYNNTASYINLPLSGVKKIAISSGESALAHGFYELDFFGEVAVTRNYEPIKNFNVEPGEREISLSWENPQFADFIGNEILVNETKILTTGATETRKTLPNLIPDKEYRISVVSLYSDGSKSPEVKKTIKTLVEIIKEILETNVKTDYNRVDLSWKIPQQYGFKHVNIYRKEVTEEPGLIESLFMGTIVSAVEEPKRIFETNGTYFNDLTVEPETTYEYTLTTQTIEGKESEGVIVEATTLEEPLPVVEGENYTIDETGDYIFTWDQPTEGTMKIIVGGKEYSNVDASAGQFLIPKEDIKINGLGDPDVSLAPVSKYGTEGEVKSISEANSILKLPFTVSDFLQTGNGLLYLVAPFLLLAMSFLLFPKFRNLVVNSFRNVRNDKEGTEKEKALRRFRTDEKEAKTIKKEKHEGKEHIAKTEKERTDRERQEREKREAAAAPKIKEPREPKERKRERVRAEKQPRREKAAREPRTPRMSHRAAREPRRKRGAS